MAEQRKLEHLKSQVGLKTYLLIFFLSTSFFSLAQKNSFSIRAEEKKDSIFISVSSNLENDTVLFSLYGQIKMKKKWVTNVYDIFSNVNNPNTSILVLNPKENIIFSVEQSSMIYSEKKLKPGKSLCRNCKRILLIGYSKDNGEITYKAFSNIL